MAGISSSRSFLPPGAYRPASPAPPKGTSIPVPSAAVGLTGSSERIRSRRLALPRVSLPRLRSPHICFLLGAFVSQSFIFLLPQLSLRASRQNWESMERDQEASAPGVRPRFVLFGDSLTQHSFDAGGWGAALQERYARKVDVVLRGYSGYNTRWALFLLPKLFPSQESVPYFGPLRVVTVFFGANDAALPDRSSKKQYVPVEEYKSNLLHIAKTIQDSASTAKVILITPPPVDEAGRLRYAREVYKENAVTVPERTNVHTKEYADACKAAASELGVPVVDLWTTLQQRPDWQSLLSDGLHFTPEGNRAVFDEVYSVIAASFPELQWDKMPWDFPEHTAIDGDQPALAFKHL